MLQQLKRTKVASGHSFVTVAVALDPSIEANHIMCEKVLRQFFNEAQVCKLGLCTSADSSCTNSTANGRDVFFEASSDIATGLACGVVLANLYLDA